MAFLELKKPAKPGRLWTGTLTTSGADPWSIKLELDRGTGVGTHPEGGRVEYNGIEAIYSGGTLALNFPITSNELPQLWWLTVKSDGASSGHVFYSGGQDQSTVTGVIS